MDWDDIVYLSLLIFTIAFGYFFRNFESGPQKKWISTTVGLIIVFLVSGKHILHPILCVLINSLIIICLDKRICHTVSFFFSFLYLIFFRTSEYVGIPYAPSHTNMIQMILTLKVVGLAFEVHDSHFIDEKSQKYEKDKISPSLTDILHYCFCYIGVLTGPYYTYNTFIDYFTRDYAKYAACESITLQRIKMVPVYAGIFLLTSYWFPIQYASTTEFYEDCSFWYRLFYITPVFITFRMRIYIGLILSECACIMAGLGAYPSFTMTKSGKGPTENIEKMDQLKSPETLKKTEYDFGTVKNIDVWYTEFDPSVRSSIRYWNMCIQYWMAFIVYKRFPHKPLRTAATFAVSAIWHGIYAGYFLCLGAVPFYLPIEDVWENLRKKTIVDPHIRKVSDIIFWFVRTQAFSYMGMAFSLLTMERGLKYYRSIYFVYHITSIIAVIVGIGLTRLISVTSKKTS